MPFLTLENTLEEIIDAPVKRYIIGDTETCGLGDDKIACQVGLIEIDGTTLEPLWDIESLIDPQHPIGEFASGMHGITNEMVVDEPTMAEFIEHRLKGPLTGSITLICHNVPFDKSMLLGIGGIDRTICTLAEARHSIPRGTLKVAGPENHKLATLAEYFGFKPDEAHKALADCYTTLNLLRYLVKTTGRTLDQLASVQKRTVHEMPWGKNCGVLIHDLPKSYMTWLLGLQDLETNLRESVQAAYKLK